MLWYAINYFFHACSSITTIVCVRTRLPWSCVNVTKFPISRTLISISALKQISVRVPTNIFKYTSFSFFFVDCVKHKRKRHLTRNEWQIVAAFSVWLENTHACWATAKKRPHLGSRHLLARSTDILIDFHVILAIWCDNVIVMNIWQRKLDTAPPGKRSENPTQKRKKWIALTSS